MTRLAADGYLRHLAEESSEFRDALAHCDPEAPVPACPDWTAVDLLWHLTQVQHFWTHVIQIRPAAPETYAEPDRPPNYQAALATFDSTSATLLATLGDAEPQEPAWSWESEQTVGFTYRRQAHEALIHRIDAEQTAGRSSEVDPAMALDGIDELLSIFYGGCPEWGEHEPSDYIVTLMLTDLDTSIWVRPATFSGTSPSSGTAYNREPMVDIIEGPAISNAQISGTSSAVLLWLWKRGDISQLAFHGDQQALDAFVLGVSESID